jgi:hypothetical protein
MRVTRWALLMAAALGSVGATAGCSDDCSTNGEVVYISAARRLHVDSATGSPACSLACANEGVMPLCRPDTEYYRVVATAPGECRISITFDDEAPEFTATASFRECCGPSYCPVKAQAFRVPEN